MSNELVNTLWKAIEDESQVMVGLNNSTKHREPMEAQIDENDNTKIWFYMAKDNRVANGGEAMVQFVGKDHKIFSCIGGVLSQEMNKSVIDKFWSKDIEAWFENGKNDTKLLMMRLDIVSAEIWTQDPSIGARIKLATGATIKPEEAGNHALVSFKR